MLRDYVKNISEDIIISPRKKVLGKGISFAIILPLRNEMWGISKKQIVFHFPRVLALFSLSFPWYPLMGISRKEKRKKNCHIINGITISCLTFPARVPPMVPSLGALFWERPITGHYPTPITVAFVAFVSADVWGRRGLRVCFVWHTLGVGPCWGSSLSEWHEQHEGIYCISQ